MGDVNFSSFDEIKGKYNFTQIMEIATSCKDIALFLIQNVLCKVQLGFRNFHLR